ncbi:FKBP-type peptidyl-prolyl cis-trans isomerase SlyD (plasmid) [Sinorhizobium fredii CCBAU 25509]|nr:FKBP-type peptidyl-prolyl cis-trans isomerase SlyD [Sinorhizobium fredii CCBAU 25509]
MKNGDVVRIHYTAKLSDGSAIDTSHGREPLEIKVGAGQIIDGLDRRISGMTVGEMNTVTIPAQEAYGPHDEAKVLTMPRSGVPEGTMVGTRLRGTTPDGQRKEFTVVELDDEKVTLDANHPLAGEDLVCDVTVLDVVKT